MRDEHIIRMLEEKPVSRLSRDEITAVESHATACPACLRAYEAARLAGILLGARRDEAVEVGPFFKTRVMAAIRERELSPELPALVRMWKAAGALVSMMTVVVVVLIGLTIFSYGPDSQVESPELASSQNIYTPEYVVFEQGDLSDDELAYDQVLATMYDSGDGDEQ